jgi:phage-related protein
VLQGLLEAGKLFVDVIKTLATHALQALKKVVQAFFALGKTLLNLIKESLTLAMNLLKAVVKAAFELGKTIVEFTRQMVEFTYRTAARLIEAALAVGAKVVDILESVAKSAYFVFRKIVNAVLQALGPVGDVLGWLLDRGEALASALWREAILAIRFVKHSVEEILDWAVTQAQKLFDRIVQLCEDVGAAITEVIDWAIARGADALDLLGGMWERIGNSIVYALNYLETDFIPGIAKFVKGALAAGYEFASLVAWTVGKAFEVTLELVRGALEAGVTLVELVVETVKHPDQAMQNLMRAARQLGNTLNQVVDAFKQAGDEFAHEFVSTMVAIGEDIEGMLLAVLEVVVGWLDTVLFELMNLLNGFRHLTAAERADAQLVFGATVNLDQAYIATDSPTNRIIFGIQDFFTGSPDSRAFVTGNLINFDVADGPIKRYHFVHEMTHVWQNQNVGPIYMAHAVFDQVTLGQEAAYNYGYSTNATGITLPNASYDGSSQFEAIGPITGEDGEAALNATDDFMDFGPEQQGQIMMQWFVRKELLSQPAAAVQPWQKFVTWVQTHPQVA